MDRIQERRERIRAGQYLEARVPEEGARIHAEETKSRQKGRDHGIGTGLQVTVKIKGILTVSGKAEEDPGRRD